MGDPSQGGGVLMGGGWKERLGALLFLQINKEGVGVREHFSPQKVEEKTF